MTITQKLPGKHKPLHLRERTSIADSGPSSFHRTGTAAEGGLWLSLTFEEGILNYILAY